MNEKQTEYWGILDGGCTCSAHQDAARPGQDRGRQDCNCSGGIHVPPHREDAKSDADGLSRSYCARDAAGMRRTEELRQCYNWSSRESSSRPGREVNVGQGRPGKEHPASGHRPRHRHPQEDLGKLFQQFQQLDSGSARHYPGSGLGLVIHQETRGTAPGQRGSGKRTRAGSTFTAVFPRRFRETSELKNGSWWSMTISST